MDICFCIIYCLNSATTVPLGIRWTSFFLNVQTEILHMHIIYHYLIYNCMFEHLILKNKSGISCFLFV